MFLSCLGVLQLFILSLLGIIRDFFVNLKGLLPHFLWRLVMFWNKRNDGRNTVILKIFELFIHRISHSKVNIVYHRKGGSKVTHWIFEWKREKCFLDCGYWFEIVWDSFGYATSYITFFQIAYMKKSRNENSCGTSPDFFFFISSKVCKTWSRLGGFLRFIVELYDNCAPTSDIVPISDSYLRCWMLISIDMNFQDCNLWCLRGWEQRVTVAPPRGEVTEPRNSKGAGGTPSLPLLLPPHWQWFPGPVSYYSFYGNFFLSFFLSLSLSLPLAFHSVIHIHGQYIYIYIYIREKNVPFKKKKERHRNSGMAVSDASQPFVSQPALRFLSSVGT